MSNALAIATVTVALAQIVRDAIRLIIPGADVYTERPDTKPLPQSSGVRLFLYQVSPNAALRNNDLPTRTANSQLMKRPTVALDLSYLIAFYGDELNLEPQRMLGATVRDLHAQPVLTRQMIKDAIDSKPFLKPSNLADAVEQVKFIPLSLSLDEQSKLWSEFFQAPYALSIVYQGSVVLIETQESPISPKPVLRRGKEDRGVQLLLGPFPIIDSIHIGATEDADKRPRASSYPSAQLGSLLTIAGHNLTGESVQVRFNHTRLPLTKTIPIPDNDRSGSELRMTILDDAPPQTGWAAGLYTVTVLVQSNGVERTSNQLALSFAAKVNAISPNPAARDENGDVTLTIACRPQIHTNQRTELLIADREVIAEDYSLDPANIKFIIKDAPLSGPELFLVRFRVDGVDSLPFTRQEPPLPPFLIFDDKQKVKIT